MPNKRSSGKPGKTPGRAIRLLAVAVAVSALLGLAAPRLGAVEQSRRRAPAHVHTVKPGETLWSVAAGVAGGGDIRRAVFEIQQLNGLAGATILPGQQLILPTG
jgi:LysM repeat protein